MAEVRIRRSEHDLRSGRPRVPSYPSFSSYSLFSLETTAGSARVVVSPSALPSAMSRSSRRMILPERVFGRSAANRIWSGLAIAPILCATCSLSSSARAGVAVFAFLERHEGGDRLTLDLVRLADDGCLRDFRMVHERALDLHRPETMARHVEHVVHAPEQPVVAVLVSTRAVAREVGAVVPAAPVRLMEALGIAVDAAQHRRPRFREREQAAARLDVLSAGISNLGEDAGKRPRRGAGFRAGQSRAAGVIRIAPVSVCHHVSTIGQRPLPMCS